MDRPALLIRTQHDHREPHTVTTTIHCAACPHHQHITHACTRGALHLALKAAYWHLVIPWGWICHHCWAALEDLRIEGEISAIVDHP